jgi:hypothetical protein
VAGASSIATRAPTVGVQAVPRPAMSVTACSSSPDHPCSMESTPGRDQLTGAGNRQAHRHPGAGVVRCRDDPGDGVGLVGGFGVGPGGQVGEVSDHL